MSVTKLLIANRNEIAIRIARAASELNIVRADFHGEWNYTISQARKPACQSFPELTIASQTSLRFQVTARRHIERHSPRYSGNDADNDLRTVNKAQMLPNKMEDDGNGLRMSVSQPHPVG